MRRRTEHDGRLPIPHYVARPSDIEAILGWIAILGVLVIFGLSALAWLALAGVPAGAAP